MPVDVSATVASNTRLSDDFNVLAIEAPAIARAARPGQFVMIKANEGTDPLLRRPFSIFQITRNADGEPAGFTLLNKRIGRGTNLLFCAPAGMRVACLGPLGRPFVPPEPRADRDSEAWMVAGGVGLAPFATLGEALRDRGTPMKLFYGARRSADLFFVDYFASLGADVILTTEDGSRGTRGFVTAPLEAALRSPASGRARIYACGPTPMMRAVAALAARHGHPCHVSLEQVMGCGLGGCYSCVVGVRRNGGSHFVRSCVEGPVFDANDIVWEELAP
jgi:dihydroorotate dehydrogenase electron transfer subunit